MMVVMAHRNLALALEVTRWGMHLGVRSQETRRAVANIRDGHRFDGVDLVVRSIMDRHHNLWVQADLMPRIPCLHKSCLLIKWDSEAQLRDHLLRAFVQQDLVDDFGLNGKRRVVVTGPRCGCPITAVSPESLATVLSVLTAKSVSFFCGG